MEILIPERRPVTLDELRALISNPQTAEPFHESVISVCAGLSRRIFRDPRARRFPELQALAFWIRPAELHRLSGEFRSLRREDRVLVPRGLVFHVPPRNVDTMFVYSWLLAALTGNCNVIRLSPLRSDSSEILLRLFREALAQAGAPARNGTLVIGYGHEQEPTELLSSLCDVRVIWGGDGTVAAIRRAPLPPHAREITFPDRYSMAAIHAGAYIACGETERSNLAEQFFNDSFWFDQLACSSPRLVIWCGSRTDGEAASKDFFPRVDNHAVRRGYAPVAAVNMQKFVFACSATLDLPVSAYRRLQTASVLTLDSLRYFERQHPGGGLFFEVFFERLADLTAAVHRKDQTLTWFGFAPEELFSLARALNGRGLDRIVPVGQALQFQRFWDGLDLLQEFCRNVYISTGTATPDRTANTSLRSSEPLQEEPPPA
jgi:hypothetical protein